MVRVAHCLLICPVILLACERPASDTGAADSGARAEVVADHASETAAGPDAATHEELPLRPIMQRLASDMTALTYALWLEDYPAMTARAGSIAEHAHISADEIQRIEKELGPEMGAFEAADERVHVAAVQMHQAAQARQLDVFVQRLGDVQRGCVACHTAFRERLRTVAP